MMKSPDEIKKGLVICSCDEGRDKCVRCPYFDGTCRNDLNAIEKDALALIQQLEAQAPRWISVEERLPEDEKDVAVIVKLQKGNWMYLTAFRLPYGGWWINKGAGLDYAEITHWMPLPEPPEE